MEIIKQPVKLDDIYKWNIMFVREAKRLNIKDIIEDIKNCEDKGLWYCSLYLNKNFQTLEDWDEIVNKLDFKVHKNKALNSDTRYLHADGVTLKIELYDEEDRE